MCWLSFNLNHTLIFMFMVVRRHPPKRPRSHRDVYVAVFVHAMPLHIGRYMSPSSFGVVTDLDVLPPVCMWYRLFAVYSSSIRCGCVRVCVCTTATWSMPCAIPGFLLRHIHRNQWESTAPSCYVLVSGTSLRVSRNNECFSRPAIPIVSVMVVNFIFPISFFNRNFSTFSSCLALLGLFKMEFLVGEDDS